MACLKNGLKTVALKLTSKIAIAEAQQAANTSCVCLCYQSKLPDAVKKLRKF